jgi:hypothetical protein
MFARLALAMLAATMSIYSLHLQATPAVEADPNERDFMWSVFAKAVTANDKLEPEFTGWINESTVFSAAEVPIQARSAFPGHPLASADAHNRYSTDSPVITFVHYNTLASQHIRANGLYRPDQLQRLARAEASIGRNIASIPDFPKDAEITMTAWWPVAATGMTALPVWDSDAGRGNTGSFDYTRWSRIVAVVPDAAAGSGTLSFAGRTFTAVPLISRREFYVRRVDASLAHDLSNDPETRKAAIIALGRPLQAGDSLLLVGMHLVSMQLRSGVWGTFWWHDRATVGKFSAGRPAGLTGPWRNYLMDVTSDAQLPLRADGSPRICFNPWFEAKFPDGGQGNGLQSNCVNCHSRASFPRIDFLPIRRGPPALSNDPAFAPGRLLTGGLWSVADPLHATSP